MLFHKLHFLIDPEPRSPAWNMAADEALATIGSLPMLRVYRWKVASVSFGYFGVHEEVISRWPGREPVRRWTGGGEVPHGDDFTYALAASRNDSLAQRSVGESYRMVHAALARCISGAELATANAAQNPACFARPVMADVLVAGRKVAGAAQRRGRFGLLHQGSVQGITLPSDLAQQFAALLAVDVIQIQYSSALLEEIDRLVATRYGTEKWLERR